MWNKAMGFRMPLCTTIKSRELASFVAQIAKRHVGHSKTASWEKNSDTELLFAFYRQSLKRTKDKK